MEKSGSGNKEKSGEGEMRKIKIISLFLLSFMILELRCADHVSFALDNNAVLSLSKQIIEAKSREELYPYFQELKELYFKENRYSELVDFLRSIGSQKEPSAPFIDYYTALARYSQLKYLESTQSWDEYFSKGNDYRDDITASAKNVIKAAPNTEPLNIYARLILWQFHNDQQDAFAESSRAELMNALSEYSAKALYIKPIKDAADALLSYGEKGESSRLYKMYVSKLFVSTKDPDELRQIASDFYKEGNLELSESVYDTYIEQIAKTYPKEQLVPVLINIARDFAYKDEGINDPSYAEKIFKKIGSQGMNDAFDEELSYLRALNAEKSKDFQAAKGLYLDLLERFPQTKYTDEAHFKVAIISSFILKDPKTGKDYFLMLSAKENSSPQVIASFYYLGLLAQWENDPEKAVEYYNELIEKSGGEFPETTAAAEERISEITDSVPLEYNLKTFLDLSLRTESPAFESGRAELTSSKRLVNKGEAVEISCVPYGVQSGCMQVEVQYLWSGDTGTAKPALEAASFNTSYAQPGIKLVSLVIVSPGGILDRSIEIIDVR